MCAALRFVMRILLVHTVSSLFSAVTGQCSGGSSSTSQTLTALTTAVQELTSLYYPSYYPNNHRCYSTITATSGYKVIFYIDYASIEYHYDYLLIGSGTDNVLFNSDQNGVPYLANSVDTTLTVRFSTDYSVTYGGFHMYYIAGDFSEPCGSSVTATGTAKQLVYVPSYHGSSCTYTIAVGSERIKITVLGVVGSIQVIEGGQTTYYNTLDSTYVSSVDGRSVQLRGTSGNGFVVHYESVFGTPVGSIVTTTASPFTSICDVSSLTSTSTAGYLFSPNYPGPYYNNIYCSVRIDADDASMSVSLTVLDMELLAGDSLTVYDGTSTSYNYMSLYDGASFNSSSYSVYLVFSTNYYGQNRGFKLEYQTLSRVTPVCSQALTVLQNVTADGTQRTLSSANYPNAYNHGIDVYYLIVKPNATVTIVLDFRNFKVEEATGCRYDYLSVYDGACTSDPLLAKLCGYDPVTFEDSTGLYVLLHFYTDGSVAYSGWELTYYIGTYQDPETDAATEDTSGFPDYAYPIIAIGIILIISAIVAFCVIFRQKNRISSGSVISAPSLKKRTTHDLLQELANRYGSVESDKKPKIKRKGKGYHPMPNSPGPNVNVIYKGQTPHPPPGAPYPRQPTFGQGVTGTTEDPAYPPEFIGMGAVMPNNQLAPKLTDQSNLKSPEPMPDMSNPKKVPPPFPYLTPAEARSAGLYQ